MIEIDDLTLREHIEYRTLDYAKAQCAKLAAQLAAE